MIVRLVKANVAIATNAKELQVGIAGVANHAVVLGASLIRVGVGPVGHKRVGKVDVDLVEKVLAHEVVVALRILMRKAAVLVQVVGSDLREVTISLVVPLGELLVGANGRGASSKAKHAVGLENHLGRDNVRRLAAHVPVVLGANDSHEDSSFC